MTKVDQDVRRVAEGLPINARGIIKALNAEYQSAPRTHTRQAVAQFATYNAALCESEYQHGCARRMYYRLTPLGLAVRSHLMGEGDA